MAIIHMDDFDLYGGNNAWALNGIYSQFNGTGLQLDPQGTGNYVAWLPPVFGGGGNYANIRYVLPSTDVVTGAACRMYLDALSPGGSIKPAPLRWLNGDGSPAITVVVEPTGQLSIRAGGFGSAVLAASVGPAVTAGSWYHIELKSNGSNTLELRVEGVTVATATYSPSTVYANLPIFELANSPDITSNGVTMLIKDLVLWNGAGSLNNNFVGTVQVKSIVPNADVSSGWTPSTGPNGWTILDNNPPNDAQFISASDTLPAPYIGDLTNLPIDAVTVKAVMTRVRAKKVDGGDGFLQTGLISTAGATALGVNRPITVSSTYWQDVFEVDPATSAPWLPQAVNNAKIRINRTL